MTRRKLTPDEIALLGTDTDVSISALLGVSEHVVRRGRVSRRIPRYKKTKPDCRKWRKWTPEEDAIIGTAADADIATVLDRTRYDVAARRRRLGVEKVVSDYRMDWPAEQDALLGTMSDRSIAKRLGVTIPTVTRRRVALGIPICSREKWDGVGKKRTISDEEVDRMRYRIEKGETMLMLAQERGVTPQAISALLKRRRRTQ